MEKTSRSRRSHAGRAVGRRVEVGAGDRIAADALVDHRMRHLLAAASEAAPPAASFPAVMGIERRAGAVGDGIPPTPRMVVAARPSGITSIDFSQSIEVVFGFGERLAVLGSGTDRRRRCRSADRRSPNRIVVLGSAARRQVGDERLTADCPQGLHAQRDRIARHRRRRRRPSPAPCPRRSTGHHPAATAATRARKPDGGLCRTPPARSRRIVEP